MKLIPVELLWSQREFEQKFEVKSICGVVWPRYVFIGDFQIEEFQGINNYSQELYNENSVWNNAQSGVAWLYILIDDIDDNEDAGEDWKFKNCFRDNHEKWKSFQ